jgi:hypothetical protein
MNRLLLTPVALFLCASTSASAQSGLSYDFSLSEKIDGHPQASTGHAIIDGNNVRMDIVGPSTLSKIGQTDLGDSLAIVSTDTGTAQVVSLISHTNREYVQMQPAVLMAKMRDAMARMQGTPMMDFTGSSVMLDSLGPVDDIAGYKTLLYRLNITIKIAVNGQPMGEQDIMTDYYLAPDLKGFSRGSAILGGASDMTGAIPGLAKSFTDQMAAASKKLEFTMAVKTSMDMRSNLFGTGSMRTQTLEASNIKRTDVAPGSFVVPAGYKRVVPKGMEKFM